MVATEPIYKLIVDPEIKKDEFSKKCETNVENMNFALKKIGEAKGWGNNPRWDLLFDAGLKTLMNEK